MNRSPKYEKFKNYHFLSRKEKINEFLSIEGIIQSYLDAIDGKQARRTGSSTPLGELFDHGCDSMSTVFVR